MEKQKSYCPQCMFKTNHTKLHEEKIGAKEKNDYDIYWYRKFLMIKCDGCDNIQFKTEYHDENMFDYFNGREHYYTEDFYYPHFTESHQIIDFYEMIPNKIQNVYVETVEAIKVRAYLLAGVGLRAVIEAVVLEQNINGRNLEEKINNLLINKFITERDANRLHSIRFLGNDAVHEMEIPSEKKIKIALKIVEQLLINLYTIDIGVEYYLDTLIVEYSTFKSLFFQKIEHLEAGSEINLREVLGRDYRRIGKENLKNFLGTLYKEIEEGVIHEISLGTMILNKKNEEIHTFIKK